MPKQRVVKSRRKPFVIRGGRPLTVAETVKKYGVTAAEYKHVVKAMKIRPKVASLVKKKSGILLDICLGGSPQPNSVVMSPTGDVKHDPRKIPFPLPDKCCHTAVITHVLEYLEPDQFFRWWDELHRIMRPGGAVYVSGPYGGDESQGWISDPTHRTRVTEQTFAWLDPRLPFFSMHKELGRKTPKPWHTQTVARVPGAHGTISINCMLTSQVSK